MQNQLNTSRPFTQELRSENHKQFNRNQEQNEESYDIDSNSSELNSVMQFQDFSPYEQIIIQRSFRQDNNLQNQFTQVLQKIALEYQQQYLEDSLRFGQIENIEGGTETFDQISLNNFYITHNNQIIFMSAFKATNEDQDLTCFVLNILNELITVENLVFFQYDENQIQYQNDFFYKNRFQNGQYYAKILQNKLDQHQISKINQKIIKPLQEFCQKYKFGEKSVEESLKLYFNGSEHIEIF